MSFMSNLKETINEGEFNETLTENGALAYRTSGKALLDLNFAVASLRNESEDQILDMWNKAYFENKLLAVAWLFFASDIRGGLGERRLFKIILESLAKSDPELVKELIDLVPEYSRWDYIFVAYGINKDLNKYIHEFIENQLNIDMEAMKENKPISLLAKWMPSINASNKDTKKLGRKFRKMLGISECEYRKMLSAMRKYLDIVERKISSNRWDEIDYSSVPSKANLKYNNAFMRHDEDRRKAFLVNVSKGEQKINSGVLFPHDIAAKYYIDNGWSMHIASSKDDAIEELWKALPDYVQGSGNTIVVADGSGSMVVNKAGNTCALTICNALAIYFAERSSGEFKDKFITFSEKPQLVDVSRCNSLHDKLKLMLSYDECCNTNIEKVFELILKTAVSKHISQEDMPKNILIISDMEFDVGVDLNYANVKLFDQIAEKYRNNGYMLPRLVFWNVCSRTNAIPIKENALGVALVSGFSPTIVKMVLSNETDPYKVMVEQLMSDRYAPVIEVIGKYLKK